MTSPSPLSLSMDAIREVVQSVFESMVGLPAPQVEEDWTPSPERLTAAVHLAGSWNGAVLLECSREQTSRIASRFLPGKSCTEVDDVARDVLGEMVNMIGGNLKCSLAPRLNLSLPSVVDGSDYSLRVCGAEVQARLAFRLDPGSFWVTVLAVRPRQPADRQPKGFPAGG